MTTKRADNEQFGECELAARPTPVQGLVTAKGYQLYRCEMEITEEGPHKGKFAEFAGFMGDESLTRTVDAMRLMGYDGGDIAQAQLTKPVKLKFKRGQNGKMRVFVNGMAGGPAPTLGEVDALNAKIRALRSGKPVVAAVSIDETPGDASGGEIPLGDDDPFSFT